MYRIPQPKLTDVTISSQKGKITASWSCPYGYTMSTDAHPVEYWKDEYGVKGDKIVFLGRRKGKFIPAEKEKYEFWEGDE